MEIYEQLMYILGFSFLGEMISKFFNLSMPGSVIGMILLFLALELKVIKLHKIEKVSDFLVKNLAILFIPAGVAIMNNFEIIKDIWLSFIILTILSTVMSLIICVKIVEYVKNKYEGDK